MKLSRHLLTIFFCSTLAASAQVDSSAQKTTTSHEKQVTDSTQTKKSVTKEKPIDKKQEKKNPKQNIVTHQGGIGNPEMQSISNSDSIQLLKDSIKELQKENAKLKKRNEKLENENESLNDELNSGTPSQRNDSDNGNHFSFLSFLLKVFLFTVLIIAIGLFILFKRGKLKFNSLLTMKKKYQQPQPHTQPQQKTIAPIAKTQQVQQQTANPFVSQPVTQKISNAPKSFSNVLKVAQKKSSSGNDWFVVGASAIGKSHITSNKPCQDNHYCENIGYGWGIAISCDGAGSADNSDLGSEYVAKDAFKILKEFIVNNGYHKKNILPSDSEWNLITKEIFKQLHQHLEKFAKSKSLDINSVACTVIAVIYSPIGLLAAHLGDGRAGYCNEKGDWKSIITPHKGEEANQTIFISSAAWQNGNDFIMSGVTVPESRVIREKPIAFTLMSDGCESHSFECSKMDVATNKWNDPNLPFPKFFNPLVEHLKELNKSKVSFDDANSKWKKFVEEGTQGIKEESDDKTLILGILI